MVNLVTINSDIEYEIIFCFIAYFKAGKFLKSGKLPKITGLDPAGPLFDWDKPESRLDKNDAKYVEIIHTNGAFLGRIAFLYSLTN